MKLGQILVQSFRSRSKKHTHKKRLRRKGVFLTEVFETPRVPASPKMQLALVERPAAVLPASPGLRSMDLIRPNENLRKSIESFLLDQRSEHTRRAYGKDLKRFMQFLLDRKINKSIDSIDRAAIIGYKDYLLSEKLEHTSVDRHLASLRSFFRWLVEDGVLPKNPAENVRFLNPKRESRTNGFTDAEVRNILDLPNLHTKTGSLHYAVLMTLFYCGLRRSELCALRTSNFGFERNQHFLRLRGKGNAERIVVLIEPVWNAIQYYLKITHRNPQADLPLFVPIRNNRTGVTLKPIDSSLVFYIVTKYAKRAGIANRVSPHSCRATAISNARDHQVPDRAIQEFAGWSTTTMITRYDKRKSTLEKSAVHAIDYGAKKRELPAAQSSDLVRLKTQK